MWNKWIMTLSVFAAVAVLGACDSDSSSEEIYGHLEESVKLEEDFVDQQGPITELEKKEKEIYNQIIELSMDEFDEIEELAKEALDSIEKRREKVAIEEESIHDSKAEFEKVESKIDDIDEDDVRKKAREMYDVMMERYDAYDDMHDAYVHSLDMETELYEMLQNEDLEQEDLSEQIEKTNDSYQDVLDANDTFNKKTVDYNTLKKDFYEAADIDVEYDDASKKGNSNDGEKNGSDDDDEGTNDEEENNE